MAQAMLWVGSYRSHSRTSVSASEALSDFFRSCSESFCVYTGLAISSHFSVHAVVWLSVNVK